MGTSLAPFPESKIPAAVAEIKDCRVTPEAFSKVMSKLRYIRLRMLEGRRKAAETRKKNVLARQPAPTQQPIAAAAPLAKETAKRKKKTIADSSSDFDSDDFQGDDQDDDYADEFQEDEEGEGEEGEGEEGEAGTDDNTTQPPAKKKQKQATSTSKLAMAEISEDHPAVTSLAVAPMLTLANAKGRFIFVPAAEFGSVGVGGWIARWDASYYSF